MGGKIQTEDSVGTGSWPSRREEAAGEQQGSQGEQGMGSRGKLGHIIGRGAREKEPGCWALLDGERSGQMRRRAIDSPAVDLRSPPQPLSISWTSQAQDFTSIPITATIYSVHLSPLLGWWQNSLQVSPFPLVLGTLEQVLHAFLCGEQANKALVE